MDSGTFRCGLGARTVYMCPFHDDGSATPRSTTGGRCGAVKVGQQSTTRAFEIEGFQATGANIESPSQALFLLQRELPGSDAHNHVSACVEAQKYADGPSWVVPQARVIEPVEIIKNQHSAWPQHPPGCDRVG